MKKTSFFYKIIKALVRFFYPFTEVFGEENLPKEPCIVVANHCQMNGPIACELYFPGKHYTWCAAEMMRTRDVPAYAYKDFWSNKPIYIRWFFKLASYIIAPLASHVFNNANCIAVYRDLRMRNTFRETLEKLEAGSNIIIFPEHDGDYDYIINDFQDRFIDIAAIYHRRTGKDLSFVPVYIAAHIGRIQIGEAVRFNNDAPKTEERQRVKDVLMQRISAIARSLPEHRVVPYRQTPKAVCPSSLTGNPYGFFRKPVVDYRQMRLNNLKDKRFSHVRLLVGWVFYFIMYMLTEKLIPESACHVVHCALDDIIPFNEYFLIFYCAWYFWIFFSLVYFLAYDIDSFKRLQTFFIIVQAGAMIVYIVYPTIQLGRPESFERNNFFTWLMSQIYAFDTPTGVCPSLHVAYSIGIAESWIRRKKTTGFWKFFNAVLCFMVSISVCFVKQHSAVDILAAIPLSVIADVLIYEKIGGRRTLLQKWLDKV